MSHPLVPGSHLISKDNLFICSRYIFILWLITISLTLGLLGEGIATGSQQRRPRARSRATGKKPPTQVQTVPANTDNELPDDPEIVAESRRLEAQRLEEQQKTERELLAKNDPAQTGSDDLWRDFRKTFLFHSQVIALSEAQSDGSRTLIISEPPPRITLGEILTTIGGDLILNHQVRKHEIGYYGWVKDVVVAIKGDDGELQAMLSRLNQRLFSTSYKSYTLKLPVRISDKPLDLNLTITPEEMKLWVVEEGEQFFPVEGGKAETLSGLAAEPTSGVYISRRRGLIGWWVPQKLNIYECRIPARQFALDADLIIGAIATPAGIFVMGRERIVPVDILPPLRFETLALLADIQDGQRGRLAQSYERNHDFAGRIEDGRDWAPILLSPQLRDTEYGSLLNITDQLLKGWSNKGETKYEKFPYPAPIDYPFPKNLYDHLGLRETKGGLTYNWNTKGAGYTVNLGSMTILALNRSGSLPVSYIPEGMGSAEKAVTQAEDDGYNYFSRLSDPNLVRVVQYAGMYQIFSAFNIARSSQAVPADDYPDQLLESMTNSLHADLRQVADREMDHVVEQITSTILKSLDYLIVDKIKEDEEEIRKYIDSNLRAAGLKPDSDKYKAEFGRILNEIKEDMRQQLKTSVSSNIRQQIEKIKLNLPPQDDKEKSLREALSSQFAALRKIPQSYSEAIDLRAKGWIHTPVVVISWNTDKKSVGGHNLDARVSKIVADEGIPPGQVKIDARGVLLVNPKDLPRARGLARNVERNSLMRELALAIRDNNPSKLNSVQMEMRNALNRAEVVAPRPRESALHLSSTPPPPRPPNKPPISSGEPSPAGGAGWGGDGRTSVAIAAEQRDSNVIQIKQSDGNRFDVYSVANGGEAFRIKGLTHEDAVDVAVLQATRRAKPKETMLIEFDGVSEQRAQATLRTMEIRMGEQGSAVELVGLTRGERSAGLSDAEILKKYDFGKAHVEVSEVKSLSTGELQQDISLNAPAADNSGSSVRFTSEVKFNSSTPLKVMTAVKERVVRAFKGLAARWSQMSNRRSYQANVRAYNKDLAIAVKKVKSRTKLKFDVKTRLDVNFSVGPPQGLRDIYIGQKDRDHGESVSGSDACRA